MPSITRAILGILFRASYIVSNQLFLLCLRTFYISHLNTAPAFLFDLLDDKWLLDRLRVIVEVEKPALVMRPHCDVYAGALVQRRGERVVIKAFRLIGSQIVQQDWNDIRESATRKMVRECFVWSLLKHENICPFKGLFMLNTADIPALVSLFIPQMHGLRAESPRRQVLRASGMKYLHDNEIMHGDIKPDNVMINDDGRVQIINFGLSKLALLTGFTTQQQGQRNPRYCAPELLRQEVIKPTFASDVYGFSMTALQILDGRVEPHSAPYNHHTSDYDLWLDLTRIGSHVTQRPQLNRYINIPTTAHGLFERCWEGIPANRPSMAVIYREIHALQG